MAFHETASEMFLECVEGRTLLYADCEHPDGFVNRCSLDLDEILYIEDGRFIWGGNGSFTETMETVELFRDDWGVPFLRATYRNEYDEYSTYEINLSERIANQEGYLVFI